MPTLLKRALTAETQMAPTLSDPAGVYGTYGARVSRWAARLAGPRADLEDIVHDVFVVAFRRRDTYQAQSGELGAWLHGITVKVVQARRRKWRVRRILTLGMSHLLPAPAPEPTPEQDAMQSQVRVRLYKLLEQLPESQRTAFILHDLEGLPAPSVAEMTNTSLGNVQVRVHRARKALTRGLDAADDAADDDFPAREARGART